MDNFDIIISIYQDFLNTYFNNEDISVELGADWCCYLKEKVIQITFIEAEEENISFINNIKKIYSQQNKKMPELQDFIWSFLHELGHLSTLQGDVKSRILRLFTDFCTGSLGLKSNFLRKVYYSIPEEQNATNWAINYINNNLNIVLNLQNKLLKKYQEFYEKTLTSDVLDDII